MLSSCVYTLHSVNGKSNGRAETTDVAYSCRRQGKVPLVMQSKFALLGVCARFSFLEKQKRLCCEKRKKRSCRMQLQQPSWFIWCNHDMSLYCTIKESFDASPLLCH